MKIPPPHSGVLPVLTERLQPSDAVIEEDIVAPFETQPSAYADAVYRGPEHSPPLSDEIAAAPTIDLDLLWAQIAPALQQRLQEQVRAEFDALAPQFAASLFQRLFQSCEQTLRAALEDAVKRP